MNSSGASPDSKKIQKLEKEKRKKAEENHEENKRDKVLTFRDMSHLSYFGQAAYENKLSN